MEYRVLTNPPASPLFRFDKVQYVGTLNGSGDQMELSGKLTFYGSDGKQQNPDGTPGTTGIPFNDNGVRIPLEVLPSTGSTLPIPPIPTAPAP